VAVLICLRLGMNREKKVISADSASQARSVEGKNRPSHEVSPPNQVGKVLAGKCVPQRTYVLHKPEYELPFMVMTDEELTASMRITIKYFIREYASKLGVPV
jgi:hypothetical protein